MSIKYYHLAKDEELPDEFCAIRDVGGEPSEYTFYVPESEVDKLREELEAAKHDLQVFSANLARLGAENAKLRELCAGLLTGYECGYGELCKGCTWDGIGDSKTFSCLPRAKARDLGVEVDA